ncbi:transglutaminase domain-containing protein [Clostridium sp. CF012]|uniref:transglutaminase domain-containing protein n=1 Tax=Clostridium sp. CF012 TaxID=2843319 RepID=UPI001C0DFAF2|nr:transglutaminase domain-containing protein [Clostridium sp. CF012]MBU3143446.1 Ig-like domain-containing protein [Clostridium sp. CF012]
MNKKISKVVLMLTITLILTIGRQAITFGVTNPTLDFLKNYKLVDTYTISNTKNGDSGDLLNTKAIINLGTDLNSPYITNVSNFKISEGRITKDANGVYVLTTIVDRTAPNASHSIFIERTFTTGTIDYNIDKSQVTSNYSQLNNYMDYLREDVGVEVKDAEIQAKAKALTENISNPFDKAFAIFRFVNTNMTYNINSQYANNGALSGLVYKEGVCQDYAQLFVALCRASGIPARTVIGFRNIEDTINNKAVDLTGLEHMWAEIYLPDYGWTIAEPTEIFTTNGVVTKTVPDNILMKYFAKALLPSEHIATSYETGVTFASTTISSNYYRKSSSIPTMTTNSNTMLYIIDDATINEIDTATKAVIYAETSKVQTNLDSARVLVNALLNGVDKTILMARLDVVQSAIEVNKGSNATKIAESAMENLTINLTLDNYKKAMDLVYKFDDSVTEKISLLETLDNILDKVVAQNQNDEKIKKLGEILDTIKKAELQTSYSTYNSAMNLMTTLSEMDFGKVSNRLSDRLSIVATKIEDKKTHSKFQNLSDSPFLESKDIAKVWNVTFTQLIDAKTVTTDNISMKNSKGELIDFKVSCNGKVISISPINKFELGEQYAVYISNKVLSMNGYGITNGWYFTFGIN